MHVILWFPSIDTDSVIYTLYWAALNTLPNHFAAASSFLQKNDKPHTKYICDSYSHKIEPDM